MSIVGPCTQAVGSGNELDSVKITLKHLTHVYIELSDVFSDSGVNLLVHAVFSLL